MDLRPRPRAPVRVATGSAILALMLLMTTTSADAEGPPPPVTPPLPPRAAPIARGVVPAPVAPNFPALIDGAIAHASDLTALALEAQQVAATRSAAIAALDDLKARGAKAGAIPDRLERQALALADIAAPLPAALSPEERDAVDEMRALRTGLEQRLAALAAEQEALTRAGVWSLPSADAPWVAPAQGAITQPFGPTEVRAEPPRAAGGPWYPHFHDGIDIGAPLYAPVAAAAPGQVVFVGHLGDGAEIVLIAHVGGYVSEYGHLDDRLAPPVVAAGDIVRTGQVIGHIGMTGNTSGPHLHFQTWHGGTLVDPLTLLSQRPDPLATNATLVEALRLAVDRLAVVR